MAKITIDTLSASDSDKVIDFLESENIKYKKSGSKITIMLDRSSLKASVILSHLQKIAKFDEISEQIIISEIKDGDVVKYGSRISGKLKVKKAKIDNIKGDKIHLNTGAILHISDKVSNETDIKNHHDFIILKENMITKEQKLRQIIREELQNIKSKLIEQYDEGLMVTPRTKVDKSRIEKWLKDSSYHAEWDNKGYFLFPEEADLYDSLEDNLRKEFKKINVTATFEGIF